MFEFYRMSYELKYLDESYIHEAAKWGCITKEQYKEIIGEEYVEK